MITNSGRVTAAFSMACNSPFCIRPVKGALHPNERMQLTIQFLPSKKGLHESNLLIHYETGEKLCVKLTAVAEIAPVHLEKGSLRFHDTYMGLTNCRYIEVFNRSKYTVRFKWKQLASHADEIAYVTKLSKVYDTVKDHESKRGHKLEWHGIIDYDGHTKVYQRIYENEVEELAVTEEFFYNNNTFKIIPMVSCLGLFFVGFYKGIVGNFISYKCV